jgi:hypothetical protein
LNLASIKRIDPDTRPKPTAFASKARSQEHTIVVYFTDGSRREYRGQPARVIEGSANMHRQIAESMIVQMLDPNRIITPAGIVG